MNSAVAAALLQASGTVLAAMVGLWLWRLQVTRDREKAAEAQREKDQAERRLRELRARDILIAIRAEVAIEAEFMLQFDPEIAEAWRTAFVGKLTDPPGRGSEPERDGRKDMPQGRPTVTMFVFEDLKPEIELIPVECIDDIVRFYKYNERLDNLIDEFRKGTYENMTDEYQIKAVDALMELGKKTLRAALLAKKSTDAFLHDRHDVESRWTRQDMARLERLEQDDSRPAHLSPPSQLNS